jgi:hypothetical protein
MAVAGMDSLRAPSKPRRISNTWWHIHSTTPRLASAACGHDCEPRSGTASRMLGYDSHTAFSCLPWVSHVNKSFPYTSGLLRALSQVILKASHTCLTQGAADGSNGSISSVADWLQADNMHFLAPCSTRPRLTNVRLAPDGAARATSSSSKSLLVFVSPSPLQQPPHQTSTTATLPTDPSSRPSCRWQKLTLEVSPRSEALGPSARGVINPSACPPPSLFPSTPVNPLNSSTQSSTFRVFSTPPSIVLFQTTIFLHFDLGHRPPQVTWHAQHVFIHTQSHM